DRPSERGIPLRFRQPERLPGAPGDPGHRRAHRRGVPLRADPAGRRVQGDGQPLAGGGLRGHPQQAGIRAAGNRALHPPARADALRPQPVLPRQHLAAHARRRGGGDRRRPSPLRRGGLPPHVGGAQEDGRGRGGPRRARRLRPRRRPLLRARPGPGGEGPPGREYRGVGRARHLRLADILRRRRHLLRQGPAARRRGRHPRRRRAV
ncbi:MAG: 2-hydroxychromene-2-carboxylate isomerase family protein, partial [uncultured Acetobacteraceae bacterium]